jgi:hypothetical protein
MYDRAGFMVETDRPVVLTGGTGPVISDLGSQVYVNPTDR